jgi:uncharacterized protein
MNDKPADAVQIAFDVPARMRDRATLCANIYRPQRAGPWPTVLTRTPNDKNDVQQHAWCGLDPVQTARRGFLVVIQDVRGRFASDGDWEPLLHERHDAYNSVQWAAALPGSNGRAGTFSARELARSGR